MTNLTAIVIASHLVTNAFERQVEGDYFPPPAASSWLRTNVVSLYSEVGLVGDGIKAALLTNTTPQFTNVVLVVSGAMTNAVRGKTNGFARGVIQPGGARGLPPVPKP